MGAAGVCNHGHKLRSYYRYPLTGSWAVFDADLWTIVFSPNGTIKKGTIQHGQGVMIVALFSD